MFIRCRNRPAAVSRRNRVRRNKCGDYTYASVLQASRLGGITVESNVPRACNAIASDVCRKAECTVSAEHELLRYKDRWERKKADVFVNHQELTGIPVFTAPDTLRIVSGECSFFVPLEQVVCIRVADKFVPLEQVVCIRVADKSDM